MHVCSPAGRRSSALGSVAEAAIPENWDSFLPRVSFGSLPPSRLSISRDRVLVADPNSTKETTKEKSG